MRYLLSFIFLSLYLYGFNYHLKAYKISDGIHCFFGLPSQVSFINGGNMINSCYVETDNGYVVIDSGPTYSYAQAAYEIMEKKKKLPVKYVINTSSDEVHVLGNEFYKEQGATLFAPKDYKKYLDNQDTLMLTHILSADVMTNTRRIAVDNYLTKPMKLNVGNFKIDIKTIKEDDSHLYVYIKKKKIIFVGDMVFNNRIIPLKYNRSLLTWEKALNQIEKLEWNDLVSAHGYVTRRSALNHTEEYLKALKEGVKRGIKEGKSKEELVQTFNLTNFLEDRQYEVWHPRNVATVYDELKKIEVLKKKMSLDEKLKKEVQNALKTMQKKNHHTKPLVKKKKLKKKNIRAIHYVSFGEALKQGRLKHKIVLVKVRSTTCKYCDQLDRVIKRNRQVREIINKYYEIVLINSDHEEIPFGLRVQSTPTLIFIQPKNKKVLMKLAGIRALGELLEILNEAVEDGHREGYLRP
jgi:glyoxylase-like metal-dependent hydrolase (beta-lactamase superfamily II)/thioredoxin-related protein